MRYFIYFFLWMHSEKASVLSNAGIYIGDTPEQMSTWKAMCWIKDTTTVTQIGFECLCVDTLTPIPKQYMKRLKPDTAFHTLPYIDSIWVKKIEPCDIINTEPLPPTS